MCILVSTIYLLQYLLMLEGVLCFYFLNFLTRRCNIFNKRRIHLVFQVTGSILALIGASIKYSEKTDHFNSLHGKLGFSANFLTVLALTNGLMSMFLRKNRFIHELTIKFDHNAIGVIAILLGIQAIVTGIFRGYYQKHIDVKYIMAMSLTVIATFAMALVFPLKSLKKRSAFVSYLPFSKSIKELIHFYSTM